MVIKPYISFLYYDSDGELVVDISGIIMAMTGNKYYLTPTPSLVDISAALKEFQDALSAAVNGGTTLTAVKIAKRAALVSLIKALALYVQATCNGDAAVLKSNGFRRRSRSRNRWVKCPCLPTSRSRWATVPASWT